VSKPTPATLPHTTSDADADADADSFLLDDAQIASVLAGGGGGGGGDDDELGDAPPATDAAEKELGEAAAAAAEAAAAAAAAAPTHVMIAYTRVFTGTLRPGDVVQVLGPKYDPSRPEAHRTQVTIGKMCVHRRRSDSHNILSLLQRCQARQSSPHHAAARLASDFPAPFPNRSLVHPFPNRPQPSSTHLSHPSTAF
jgi:hypothetical protein